MRGVGAAGSWAAKLPFIRSLVEVVEHWLGKLARFVERIGGRAESRAATEVAEDAATQIVRRGEREAVEGAEHAAAQTARRGEREVAETAETAAERASRVVRLRLEARAFTEAAEKAHVPVVALIPSLDAWFMPRYRWLTGFISEPLPIPGHFRIAFTASGPTTFDPDYHPGPALAKDELEALLPGVSLHTQPRLKGLDMINQLPANDREYLLAHLRQLDPEGGGGEDRPDRQAGLQVPPGRRSARMRLRPGKRSSLSITSRRPARCSTSPGQRAG